jgi:hypothetical protein
MPEVTVELRGDGWRIDAHAPKDDDGIPVVRLLRQWPCMAPPATEDHLSLARFEVPTALADLKPGASACAVTPPAMIWCSKARGWLPLAASMGLQTAR